MWFLLRGAIRFPPTLIYCSRYTSNNCLISPLCFHPLYGMLCIYRRRENAFLPPPPPPFHLKASDLSAECLHMLHASHTGSCRPGTSQELSPWSFLHASSVSGALCFACVRPKTTHTPLKTPALPSSDSHLPLTGNDCVLITFRNSG